MNMNEKTHQTVHGTLNYIEGPANGPATLLLHGSLSRWQSFLPIISELSAFTHLFALDLRGHGKSSHLTGTYKLQDYVEDVASFIKDCIKEPTVIFGHSVGGMIATMLAASHPQLVKAIIIGDAPLSIETLREFTYPQKELVDRVISYLQHNQTKKLYEEINDDFAAESVTLCDPDVLTANFDRFETTFGEYQTDKLFQLIKCPTLIMRANENMGSMVTDEDIHAVSKISSWPIQIESLNAGHALLTDKDNVLRIMTSFLQQLKCH